MTTDTPVAANPGRRRRRRREAVLAYLLLLPSLVIFAAFIFYPFGRVVRLGFYRPGLGFGAAQKQQYVGWKQWRDVLSGSEFRHTLGVTLKFTALTVPFGIALGLVLAVVAHQRLRGITIFRTIFSSTVATSIAVASVIFFSLTNPVVGLWRIRIDGVGILDNPKWALPAICAITVWQSLGLAFIVMSSGLQTIPDDLVDAARVDGAGTFRIFRSVTLPLLTPTLFFAFVVGTISSLQAFAQVDLLTQGGPLDKTRTLTFAIYDQAFKKSNQNTAAVLALGLFVFVLLLTILQLRLERRVNYAR